MSNYVLQAPAAEKQPTQVTPTKHAGRVDYADVLRAIAITQVINCHCASMYLGNLSSSGSWYACLIPEVLGRNCVPIFLMLTGMFLLGKDLPANPFVFLKTRLMRILAPLAAYSVIFLFWASYIKHEPVTFERIGLLLSKPAYYHMGYLYFLVGLYLAVPVLAVWAKNSKQKDFQYFLFLWVISSCAVPALFKYAGLNCGVQMVVATHLTGYLVLGYAIKDWNVKKSNLPLVWLTGLTACAAAGIACYFDTLHNSGHWDPFWVESASPLMAIWAVALFLIVKAIDYEKFEKKFPSVLRLTKMLGESSFTMYLVHPIILDLCTKFKITTMIHKSNFFWTSVKITMITVIVLSVTFLIARLAKRLKAPSWLVP